MANQKSLRMEYIFPPGAGKMLFIYRDFCAEDRVPVGTESLAKNRSKSDSICLSQGWEDFYRMPVVWAVSSFDNLIY